MDDLYAMVFGVCVAWIAVEMLSRLFPENSGELIRGIAVLAVLAALVIGVFKIDIDFKLPFTEAPDVADADPQAMAAEHGTAILRERLYLLLDTAGVQTEGGEDGIEVRYRQRESGEIDIDRICVSLVYDTDRDRAFAVLRSVLTEAIPIEIYTKQEK